MGDCPPQFFALSTKLYSIHLAVTPKVTDLGYLRNAGFLRTTYVEGFLQLYLIVFAQQFFFFVLGYLMPEISTSMKCSSSILLSLNWYLIAFAHIRRCHHVKLLWVYVRKEQLKTGEGYITEIVGLMYSNTEPKMACIPKIVTHPSCQGQGSSARHV